MYQLFQYRHSRQLNELECYSIIVHSITLNVSQFMFYNAFLHNSACWTCNIVKQGPNSSLLQSIMHCNKHSIQFKSWPEMPYDRNFSTNLLIETL